MKNIRIILLPALLAAIAIVSLALGVANYIQEEQFFASATQATGTITSYGFVSRGQYCALLVFEDNAGQRQEFMNTSDCVSTAQGKGHIGQTTTIYYDAKDPSRTSQIRGLTGSEGSGLIVGIIVFIIVTVVALGVFVGSVFVRRRSAR